MPLVGGVRTIKKTGATGLVGDVTLSEGANVTLTQSGQDISIASGGGGVTDGDKGDITVSASGATWTIDNDVVTYAKVQNVSATDKVLGRSSVGAGDVEEIPCTAAGRALLDDTDASAQRTTLGLGTIATQAASSVSITGGSVTGITDLAIADGGTGASTAQAAINALTAVASATNEHVLTKDTASGNATFKAAGGISDGDKGDITVSASGATWTIDNDAVTYAKIQNVTDARLLGRSAGSAGDAQEITINSGLILSGGVLNGEIRGAAPSASDFAINVATPGTDLFSKSVTIAVGDVILLECEFAILNNSGAVRTYTFRTEVGALGLNLVMGGTIAASATNRTPFYYSATAAIVATNSVRLQAQSQGGAPAAIGTANTQTAALCRFVYNTSTSDLTGAQTVAFSIFSDNTTATQTAHLIGWRIRRIVTV